MLRSSSVLFLSLALVACGGTDTTADSGIPGTDAGDAGTVRTDSGPRPDGGPPDECRTDDAISTVGCNGWLSGDPEANAAFGSCTPGGEDDPAGSCTTANAFCAAGEGEPEGQCIPACPEAGSYVTTGGCPTGSRCFTLDGYAICFRDCDGSHPCAAGEECDAEGSCVPGDAPPVDGGTPDAGTPDASTPDASTPDTDGGIVLPDASIDVDASLPDAGIGV